MTSSFQHDPDEELEALNLIRPLLSQAEGASRSSDFSRAAALISKAQEAAEEKSFRRKYDWIDQDIDICTSVLMLFQGRFEDLLRLESSNPKARLVGYLKVGRMEEALRLFPKLDAVPFDDSCDYIMSGNMIFDLLCQHLTKEASLGTLDRFWSQIIEKARDTLKDREGTDSADAAKERLLHRLSWYRKILEAIGVRERVALADVQIALVKDGISPPVADKRKMTEDIFWDLIKESASQSSPSNALEVALSRFSTTSIVAFARLFSKMLKQLSTWEIWGAAFVVKGGCSDDSFAYFRAWIIGQGKSFFYGMIDSPDATLVKQKEQGAPFYENEAILYVPERAFQSRSLADSSSASVRTDYPVRGKEWEESELPKLYPLLTSALKTALPA